jgi:hypothetical protein
VAQQPQQEAGAAQRAQGGGSGEGGDNDDGEGDGDGDGDGDSLGELDHIMARCEEAGEIERAASMAVFHGQLQVRERERERERRWGRYG